MANVLAFAEQRDGQFGSAAREAVSVAARLADASGGVAHALVLGGSTVSASPLTESGARRTDVKMPSVSFIAVQHRRFAERWTARNLPRSRGVVGGAAVTSVARASQLLDTAVYSIVVWWGTVDLRTALALGAAKYVFKIVIAAIDTIFIYWKYRTSLTQFYLVLKF